MNRPGTASLMVWLLLCCFKPASAHEVRPAVLEAIETAPGIFLVTWKQPVLDQLRLPIDPVFPASCKTIGEPRQESTPGALVERWTLGCPLREGRIEISGLSVTLTDVFLKIQYLDRDPFTTLLRAREPGVELGSRSPAVAGYFSLGVEHLLFGIDHLLFVIGLVLFIRQPVTLVKTVTAFTAAHSITLAASVLGIVKLQQGPVEAVIALSILFLARELMLPEARRSRILGLRPWLMAGAFGLLHGFGFAGALGEIGLPDEHLGFALLLFNLGIEAGQLAVIALLLIIGRLIPRLLRNTAPQAIPGLVGAATLLMGTAAGFWTIERTASLF